MEKVIKIEEKRKIPNVMNLDDSKTSGSHNKVVASEIVSTMDSNVKNNNIIDLTKLDYINCCENEKTGKTTYKILCPELAEHIRNESNYLFVRDNASQEPRRYFYIKNDGYYSLINDDEMKGFIKGFIPLPLQKISDIKEVMGLLYTDLNYVNEDMLNANENIINFKNGTLELDTLTLREHSPEDFCTIQVNANWNKNAVRPKNSVFEYFINFLTDNDEETKLFLLQYIGVIISNVKGYKMKKALFMTGESNAGKSQLKKIAEILIGKGHFSGADLAQLEARFGETNAYNKRLVGSSDMSYVAVNELKMFKLLTGGDSINAEFKGKSFFEFTFNGLLWFCCNKLPKFGGDKGDPVFNRMVVIECNNVAEVLDPQLLDKMILESDYIIKMCVLALKMVIKNNYKFDIPQKSVQAVKNFKIEVNSFLAFYDSCIIEDNSEELTPKELYNIYCNWCKSNGYKYPQTKKEIKKILEEKETLETKRTKVNNFYTKIKLNVDTIEEYTTFYENNQENPYIDYEKDRKKEIKMTKKNK